jgi:hypothetical protein
MDMIVGQLAPEQIAYFKANIPPCPDVEDAYDYEAYLQQVFH